MSSLPQTHVDAARDRALGIVAGLFSAGFVFLLGGAAVLLIWVGQRDAGMEQRTETVEVAASVEAAPEIVDEIEPAPAPRRSQVKRPAASTRPAPKVKEQEPEVASTPPVPVVPVAAPVASTSPEPPRSGKGVVMVVGSASRIRLMGAKGTFGPGTVPAGSYTIQATFTGGDPRMAGTVEVFDGDRLQVSCSASTQRCVKR